nr:alpha/beta fold hydrolase [Streptomyces sp. SID8354]
MYYQRLAAVGGPAQAPTIVCEGGLAASRSYWAPFQQAVKGVASSVVYDRSGLGRSAPAAGSRRLAALARDLNDLLDHLGPGPFVLVGHSWGGPLVRLAAAERPDRIAGLMLVDPTDEACPLLLQPSTRRQERLGQYLSAALARLGLLGFAYRSLTAALPADAAADMRAEGYSLRALRTRARELEDIEGDLRSLLAGPPPLPDIPLTVVSAGRTSIGMPRRVRAQATASQLHRARQSPRGRHVVIPHADHMVPVTAPTELAEEATRLLGR